MTLAFRGIVGVAVGIVLVVNFLSYVALTATEHSASAVLFGA